MSTVWFLTFDGYLVNLALAARVYPRKTEDGKAEVVATIPGWREIDRGRDYELRAGYVPLKLVSCGDIQEAERVTELFYRALKAGMPAASLSDLLDLEDAGDA